MPSFDAWEPPPATVIEGPVVDQSTTYSVTFDRHAYETGAARPDVRTLVRDAGAFFLTPLRKIERVPYEGPVYNLEVDDPDHSYVAPFLAVGNCQNFDISKARDNDRLQSEASPEAIAEAAARNGCKSVAFTYNDPVIFAEYAMDVADACHARGIKTVAVTAGYMHDAPRREFYAKMDAANVDLKAFSEDFYWKVTSSHLAPVLETLRYLKRETRVWFEITTLLIPGKNDSDREITEMCAWIAEHLGLDVPLHFTAFHPDYKMTDLPATPAATLRRARAIARAAGLRYVYTGNVHDEDGGTTACPACARPLIVRDWYDLRAHELAADGRCPGCGAAVAGHFDDAKTRFGRRRVPLAIAR
jgi:pyruvate formate lyase activating enzyme